MSPEINVAIVDDESIQLESMKTLINKAATELSINVQLHYFSSGEEFLFKLDEHKNLAMVFLDIEMKNIDGLEIARKIREKDKLLTIVFATAYAEYAVQGYEVQALDYLLKPIEVDKIKRVLQRHLDRKPLLQESMTLEVKGHNQIRAYSDNYEDNAEFIRLDKPDASYVFIDPNPEINVKNWFTQDEGEVDLFPSDCYSILDTIGALMQSEEDWEALKESAPEVVKRSIPRSPVTLLWVANKMKNIFSEDDIKEINNQLIKIKKA